MSKETDLLIEREYVDYLTQVLTVLGATIKKGVIHFAGVPVTISNEVQVLPGSSAKGDMFNPISDNPCMGSLITMNLRKLSDMNKQKVKRGGYSTEINVFLKGMKEKVKVDDKGVLIITYNVSGIKRAQHTAFKKFLKEHGFTTTATGVTISSTLNHTEGYIRWLVLLHAWCNGDEEVTVSDWSDDKYSTLRRKYGQEPGNRVCKRNGDNTFTPIKYEITNSVAVHSDTPLNNQVEPVRDPSLLPWEPTPPPPQQFQQPFQQVNWQQQQQPAPAGMFQGQDGQWYQTQPQQLPQQEAVSSSRRFIM